MAHLFIIRGLPGSGKSTFSLKLKEWGASHLAFETDSFFYDKEGVYHFDASQLSTAHEYCQQNTFLCLSKGFNVSVSNTFVRKWEMQPYINFCKEKGHTFTIITCEGDYGNVHGVPQEVVERMRQKWEKI